MDIIVLVKQVPDVSRISAAAWDLEKGTLRRNMLDAVINPHDLQAFTFASRLREQFAHGKLVCLSMGPAPARDMLEDLLARGADGAVLLSDGKFSGADTPATAYAIACAIRRVVRDAFGNGPYLVVSGMQSVDGDTAQVPAQVAEELGIEQIAYARSFNVAPGHQLRIERITEGGTLTMTPRRYPVMITVASAPPAPARSLPRLLDARRDPARLQVWGAADVDAAAQRIGFKGARTWVSRISVSTGERSRPCAYPPTLDELLDRLAQDLRQGTRPPSSSPITDQPAAPAAAPEGEVWVYAQTHQGAPVPVALELLAKARELARPLNARVAAVLCGDDLEGLAPRLFAAGADRVHLVSHPLLKDFRPLAYARSLAPLVLALRPRIFLFGATPLGRELAPRVAYASGCGLTADCTGLEIVEHPQHGGLALKQVRPALGGNIMAAIFSKDSFCQMATVRPGVFPPLSPPRRSDGEIVRATAALGDDDVRLELEAFVPVTGNVDLAAAPIVISGGRGLGSGDGFAGPLKELAGALEAWLKAPVEIAGSRLAVDAGFIGRERQVGQTGQVVAPRLYVAVGISGAIQHIAGMSRSSLVLALNRDPHAPIFHHADYGIVAPFEEALPQLVAAIRRRCA